MSDNDDKTVPLDAVVVDADDTEAAGRRGRRR